ncbi:MAG: DUF2846 domain-containing protein [Granulosicoccaceae bacterium]|jgi:hypothetical protein
MLPAIIVILLASGCASVPMASLDEDTRAKTFNVSADKANLYVYRNESMGGAVTMTVSLDGKVAGMSGPKTYFLLTVEPGEHTVSSYAENVSTLTIKTEAGKNYYIWQEVKMGFWMARSLLQQVDEETGRAGVLECKRAKSNF